ncbi:MAG TPA: 6,7-dimethyl-8-ribityllumazine synthase [Spirochaetota bacterium]|nr:6,7-dimethyl-8-ribityllumazine synthase [Spirochaetota bacterium]
MKVIEGKLDASGLGFGIVVSRFNEFITQKLLGGAIDCLKRNNADENNITVLWVPGSFEIPAAAKRLVDTGSFDAVICLGAVIRGATPHFDFVASEVSKGVAQISLAASIPVVFGVLTTDSIEQAIERAGSKSGNKGFDAALSAIEMANIFKQIR